MLDWSLILRRTWRGAVIGLCIGMLGAVPIGFVTALVGQPVLAGVTMMIADGTILGGIAGGVHEWMRQKGMWQS